MSTTNTAVAEVFSAQEIARAAGVSLRDVRHLLDAGSIRTVDGGFVAEADAIRAVRLLRDGAAAGPRELFAPPPAGARSPARGLLGSGALHAAMLATLVIATTLGLKSEVVEQPPAKPARLVFLATKGPGGGGGGGGLRQPAPPPKAQMKGPSQLRSPVPPPRPITSRKPEPKVQRPLTPPVRPA